VLQLPQATGGAAPHHGRGVPILKTADLESPKLPAIIKK
jgi:hypothetical protein